MKMSSEKRKELQAQYKQIKPDMGIFAVINKLNGKYFLETTQNLKGKINGTRFQLNAGSHPHKKLQKDWHDFGADGFDIKVLEQIEYDQDEAKTDYSEELELLKMIWMEKLAAEMMQFY